MNRDPREGRGRGGQGGGEPNLSHLPVLVVPVSVCRGLVVPPVVVVVAATSWVVAFPPSLLAVLPFVSPVVTPSLWLSCLQQ